MDDGAKLEAQGDLKQALELYVRTSRWDHAARVALSLDRNLDAAKYLLSAKRPYDAAVCFQKAGALKECLAALTQVPPTSPRYRHACVHAVRVALIQGTPMGSLLSFVMPFISTVPTSRSEAAALNQLAAAFAKGDKLRLASSIYLSVLSAFPDDGEAAESLAGVKAPSPSAPSPKGSRPSTPRPGNRAARVGELLVARGDLNQLQLDLVLRQQPEVGASEVLLGEALVATGLVSDLQVVQALSEHAGLPYVTEEQLLATASADAARLLTLEQVVRWKLVPISLNDRQLTVAMREPRDIAVIDALRFATGVNQIAGVFATEMAIRRTVGKLYRGEDPSQQDVGEWRGQGWVESKVVEAPSPFSDRFTGTRERQFDSQDLEKRMKAELSGEAAPPVQRTMQMVVFPEVGTTFAGRYKLEEVIGEGGSAAIFRAIDIELGEPVALKLFRPSTPEEAEHLIARFKLELSLSRQLSHPNIVRLFDLGSHEGWRYLTMELLEGTDLALRLTSNGKPLPVLEGIRMLEQICVGLQLVHAQGVVHRDIKPQNIFITREGMVKLMDFGIAKKLRSPGVTVVGMVAGTPDFISPEQIKSFSSVTQLTDLYALGATAYMMFTGAPPFAHPDLIGLLMAQANERPTSARAKNPLIPPALDAVILKLLEKDPAQRFASAQELGEALKKIRLTLGDS